jgi:signal transduction histidine kinase
LKINKKEGKTLQKPLFILLLLSIIFLNSCTQNRHSEIPVANKGIIDLRNWNFKKNAYVDLSGEWELYWNKIYSYDDFINRKTDKPQYVSSGILWNSLPVHYPLQGVATYRLKILLSDTSTFFNLFLKEAPYSASKIFVNNVLIGSNGKISDKQESYTPSYFIEIKPFKGDTLLNLIVQISNFEHNRSGGIIFNATFGDAYSIAFLKQKSFIINLLIAGGIIVVMIYHFAFYLMWRSTKSNLYFAVFSLFILLYITSLFLFPYLVYNFHYIRAIRIFGWFMAVPVFMAFVRSIFPTQINKTVIKIFSSFALLSFLLYLLKIEHILDFYRAITVIAQLYIIIAAIRLLRSKYIDAKVFFIGILFVTLSGINDALTHLELIHSTDLLPFGVFMFLLTQSYILAQRYANAYKNNKKLSDELMDTNKNLEKLVLERTKRIEEQNIRLAELNVTKDRFFGIIAHNLRGPVGNWASSLGLLIDTYDRLDDVAKLELITGLKSSTDKTFHLLENLLIWSRIQRNIITYSPQNIFFKEIIDENIEILKPAADFKNISLSVVMDEHLKTYCDPYMMNNVLRNLLSNAIKFTPQNGSVNIKVHSNNGFTELIISDTGIGISPNKLEQLFKIEKNILSKGTNGETGSGLGLILCKEFIDRHKGSIFLQSKAGKGTTVSVKLPQNNFEKPIVN